MTLEIVAGTQWGDEGKGRIVDLLAAGANVVARYNPVCRQLPGWQEDLTGVRSWSGLPAAACRYLEEIEQISEVRVSLASVGPERDQVVRRD